MIKFAGYWSFFPALIARLSNKKTVIITGGTDCVSFPTFGYGNFQNKSLAAFTTFSFRRAHHIVALHESMIFQDYNYDPDFGKTQGIKAFIPDLKTPFSIISNGYNPQYWKQIEEKIPNTFITVAGGIDTEKRRILKGIDLILEVAPHFPSCKFILVGANVADLPEVPKNVELIGFQDTEQLISHYSRAAFYLQLSVSEGFPNALCEAMLCNCVPIVSEVASMPFIVANTGFILKNRNTTKLKSIIEQALKADLLALGKLARNRIAENFSEEKRGNEMKKQINGLMD
jgi:glycosyltransferase involved in cell wall biosynthesis